MAKVTGYTAARMQQIIDSTIVDGLVNSLGRLILRTRGGVEFDAGNVVGPVGPTGTVVDFAGDNAPDGWLLCQGQTVSRDTYFQLFAILGTKFGSGDGTTTFNLPDLRDAIALGKGTTFSNVGASAGANSITLTANQSGLRSHTHTQAPHNHTFVLNVQHTDGTTTSAESLTSGIQGGGRARYNGTTANVTPAINAVSASNALEAHSIMQRSVVFNKIIKV